MQMIIILFVFAFLIGFFFAHFMRKGAYKHKYEQKLTSLEEEEKKSAYIYTQTLEKEQQDQTKYNKIHDLYKAKKSELQELRNKEASMLQQITALEEQKEEYKEKFATVDSQTSNVKNEITKLSSELNQLRELRDIISTNNTKITALEEQLQDKKKLITSYRQDIDKLKDLRKELSLETKMLHENEADLKKKLFEKSQLIKSIEEKYKNEIDILTENNFNLKITALNYEYAVKEYETVSDNHPTKVKNPLIQKVFRTPNSKAAEIDNIIQKNDHKRWIDTLRKKFFSKPSAIDKEI